MATFTFDTHKHMDNYVDVACKIAARAVLEQRGQTPFLLPIFPPFTCGSSSHNP